MHSPRGGVEENLGMDAGTDIDWEHFGRPDDTTPAGACAAKTDAGAGGEPSV